MLMSTLTLSMILMLLLLLLWSGRCQVTDTTTIILSMPGSANMEVPHTRCKILTFLTSRREYPFP